MYHPSMKYLTKKRCKTKITERIINVNELEDEEILEKDIPELKRVIKRLRKEYLFLFIGFSSLTTLSTYFFIENSLNSTGWHLTNVTHLLFILPFFFATLWLLRSFLGVKEYSIRKSQYGWVSDMYIKRGSKNRKIYLMDVSFPNKTRLNRIQSHRDTYCLSDIQTPILVITFNNKRAEVVSLK